MGVDRETQRFVGRRITEFTRHDRPEHIFVMEMARIGEVALGLRAVGRTSPPERLHTAQRQPAVADAAVKHLPRSLSPATFHLLPPLHILFDQRQIVKRPPKPRRRHAVVAPPAPVAQLVAENPCVGMADQDIFGIGKRRIELLAEHHAVVTRNAVAPAEPLVADGARLQPQFPAAGGRRHPPGMKHRERPCGQHADVVPQRRLLVGRQLPIDGNDDAHERTGGISHDERAI